MAVSLSGLDLSFLKKNDSNGCRPGRYRMDKATGESVPIAEWHRRNPPSRKRSNLASPYFMPDIAPFVNIARSDNEVISSRPQKQEMMKKHDLIECGDIKDGEIVANNFARKAHFESLAEGVESGWCDPT